MKLPIGRTISYIVAGMFCAAGIFFLITSHNCRRDFYRWQKANLIDISIDMSVSGQFAGTFVQTCQVSHGETLCLLLPSNIVASSTWTNLLKDLRFVVQIQDGSGREKVRGEFTGELFWRDYLLDGAIPLLQFAPFEKGTYRLELTVTEGVPSLQGVRQHLVARYILCGLEMMPAFITMALGVGGVVIGAIIALVTALVARRNRKMTTEQSTA